LDANLIQLPYVKLHLPGIAILYYCRVITAYLLLSA
jgi:hypothetical protein